MIYKKPLKRVFRSFDDRNWDDPIYVAFRKAVLKRDKYRCQWPNCKHPTKQIKVHHIKTWAKYPGLRFVVNNGICLCRSHHDSIKGKEEDYERVFIMIVCQTNQKNLKVE